MTMCSWGLIIVEHVFEQCVITSCSPAWHFSVCVQDRFLCCHDLPNWQDGISTGYCQETCN